MQLVIISVFGCLFQDKIKSILNDLHIFSDRTKTAPFSVYELEILYLIGRNNESPSFLDVIAIATKDYIKHVTQSKRFHACDSTLTFPTLPWLES